MWHLKNVMKNDQNLGDNPFGKKRFITTLFLTLIALSTLVYTNWTSYHFFRQMFMDRFSLMGINSKIPQLDEALTMSVNLAVATGDPRWEKRYDTLVPKLDSLILLAMQITKNFSSGIAALQIDSANLLLVNLEKKTFELVQSGHLTEAKAILSSTEYTEGKKEYQNAFQRMQSDFWNYNQDLMKKEHFKMIFSLISAFILFPLLLFTWHSVLISMQKYFNDRKYAEELLYKFEKRYRELVENLNDVIFTLNKDGIITYISPQVYNLYNYKPDELIGEPFTNIIYEKDILPIYRNFQRTLENSPGTSEFRYVAKNGNLRWAQTRGFPILKDGKATGINGIFTDIDERKQIELKVVESEKRFKTIIDQSPIAIALLNTKGHPVVSNAALSRMVGYSSKELSRMTFAEFTFPEDVDKDLSQFEALLAGKIPEYRLEKRFVHKNGSLVWGNLYVTIRRDINGQPEDIIGMAEDITERKKAEYALAESEAFLNSIIDSTNDLIWAVDSEQFRLLTFNKGLKDYFMQIGIQIWKGMPLEEMLPGDKVNNYLNLYLQTLKEGSVSKIHQATMKNRILWLNLHLLSKENKPYAISVFGKDITELKDSETRITNQIEELRRWNEATINREDRILELKRQVNELLEEAGKPPIYQTY
jgi:PAS domain S-box-containing protein